MATTLSPELLDKINDVKDSQNRIETNLNNSKDAVKESLVNSVKKVMNVDDFINNQDYLNWYKHYETTVYGPVPDADKESMQNKWLESLKKDGQNRLIDLLAEYSIDAEREQGHNNWEKDLTDAQKAKEVTKKAVAVQAKQVIASYKQLMAEHEKLIADLKAEITEDKKNLIDLNKDLARLSNEIKDKNGTKIVNTDNAAEQLKESIANLDAEIKIKEDKLEGLEEQTSVYKKAIEEAISSLEESLKKDGIYVGSYEGLGENSQTSENAQNNNVVAGNGSRQGGVDERKPKDIARAMMTDFRNLAPEEIMEMVEHTGYGDLLNMSRELGPINRKNFDRVMQNRLEDLQDGLHAVVKDKNGNDKDITISLKELLNLADSDNELAFNKANTLMKYYTNNYQTMSVHERRKAEEIMNYLKIATLLTESKRGAVGRFVGRFTQRGTRINEIGNSLRRFATERGKREAKKWERNQDIRDRLGFKTPIPSTTRKKHIDRTGNKPIQMEYGDE